jgi:hypothetical protein
MQFFARVQHKVTECRIMGDCILVSLPNELHLPPTVIFSVWLPYKRLGEICKSRSSMYVINFLCTNLIIRSADMKAVLLHDSKSPHFTTLQKK